MKKLKKFSPCQIGAEEAKNVSLCQMGAEGAKKVSLCQIRTSYIAYIIFKHNSFLLATIFIHKVSQKSDSLTGWTARRSNLGRGWDVPHPFRPVLEPTEHACFTVGTGSLSRG
jgi:hypothetical protein